MPGELIRAFRTPTFSHGLGLPAQCLSEVTDGVGCVENLNPPIGMERQQVPVTGDDQVCVGCDSCGDYGIVVQGPTGQFAGEIAR